MPGRRRGTSAWPDRRPCPTRWPGDATAASTARRAAGHRPPHRFPPARHSPARSLTNTPGRSWFRAVTAAYNVSTTACASRITPPVTQAAAIGRSNRRAVRHAFQHQPGDDRQRRQAIGPGGPPRDRKQQEEDGQGQFGIGFPRGAEGVGPLAGGEHPGGRGSRPPPGPKGWPSHSSRGPAARRFPAGQFRSKVERRAWSVRNEFERALFFPRKTGIIGAAVAEGPFEYNDLRTPGKANCNCSCFARFPIARLCR